ncbi:MAG: hypothetical protein A3H41_02685 [Omnitrophica WOR_2 bacterium RIFCSPLOWO2_02_FULL_45_28]|nr:MAG: hypothetical protein A3H41_02685 [Omnitrophica WOR_2 bacterium RIFCSPLOWO2_02_FULL_45_28]
MKRQEISLKQAIDFHGHLGPYLVLGLLMGDYALKKLKARAHFGLEVKVWGVNDKPQSCLVDGLQLSTGCTYGKGNIRKYNGRFIKAGFLNCDTNKSIGLALREKIIEKLSLVCDNQASEKFARELFRMRVEDIFIAKNIV